MKRNFIGFLVAFASVASLLLIPSVAQAQVAPTLGAAEPFGALGDSGVTGSTGLGTDVVGDVGSFPTATIINFPPSEALPPFTEHFTADAIVQQAQTDATAASVFLAGQGPGTVLDSAQLAGRTLTSGIYSVPGGAADLSSNGVLTLNGGGVFIFQLNALTANVGSSVVGTADPCSVFWRVGTSATLNGTTFMGTVLADASITLGAGSNVTGRLLAGTGPTGAITMAGSGGNVIGGCGTGAFVPPPAPAGTIPMLDHVGLVFLALLLAAAGVIAISRISL